MNATEALRFIEHEASYCRSHDSHEALCLLIPAVLKALELQPMNGYEAETFKAELRENLTRARAPQQTQIPKPSAPPVQFEKNLVACAAELWRRFV